MLQAATELCGPLWQVVSHDMEIKQHFVKIVQDI